MTSERYMDNLNEIKTRRIELKRLYRPHDAWRSRHRDLDKVLSLKDNYVSVILGDKGSGKTTELYHKAELLKKNTPNCVLIFRLEELIKPLNQSAEIDAWNAHEGVRYLFLDSLDECRLRQNANEDDLFSSALENLSQHIKLSRNTKIIISSRVAAWRGVHDKNIVTSFMERNNPDFAQIFKKSETNKDEVIVENPDDKITFLEYEIQDLDDRQVSKIAKKQFPDSADWRLKLIKKLPKFYYATPIECMDTLKYIDYLANDEISQVEFLRLKLRSRYRELNAKYINNERLSIKKVEAFTQRAAIATILCKTLSFHLRQDYNDCSDSQNKNDSAISLYELFPESEIADIHHYLSSTLFVSNEQYNRVKFYNETIRDYAAFLWLQSRLERHSYSTVFNFLFNKAIDGKYYPKEAFIIPIVMMANTDRRIQRELMANSPDLLVKHSQYCQFLNEHDKIEVLKNLFEKYSYRIIQLIRDTRYVEAFLYYFSKDADLVSFLMDKLRTNLSESGKTFVYNLLAQQSLSSIDSETKSALMSYIENDFDRPDVDIIRDAIPVLVKLEVNDSQFKRVRDKLFEKPIKDLGVYISIFNAAYPKCIDIKEGLNLLSQTSWQSYNLDFILENMTKHDAFNDVELIKAIGYSQELSRTNELFFKMHVSLFAKSLENNVCFDGLIPALYNIFLWQCSHTYNFSYEASSFNELKNALSSQQIDALLMHIKSLFFNEAKAAYFGAFYHSIEDSFLLDKKQITKLILELSIDKCVDVSEQCKLFQLARYGNRVEWQISIEAYADSESKNNLLLRKLEPDKELLKAMELSKCNEKERNETWAKKLAELMSSLDDIRSGDLDEIGYLYSLHWGSASNPHLGDCNLDKLTERTSAPVVEAFKEGICNFLIKTIEQSSSSDEFVDKKHKLIWLGIMLLGINLSYEKDKANFLPDGRYAKVALRLGLYEINGLPPWYDVLLRDYEEEAQQYLAEYIEEHFCDEYSEPIFRLYQLDAFKHKFYYEKVLSKITREDNLSIDAFKQVMQFLAAHPNSDANALIPLLNRKISDSATQKNTSIYLCLMNIISPSEFISQLKKLHDSNKITDDLLTELQEELYSNNFSLSVLLEEAKRINWDYIYKFTDICAGIKKNDYPNGEVLVDAHSWIFGDLYTALTSEEFDESDRENVIKLAKIYPLKILSERMLSKMDSLYYQNNSTAWREYDIVRFEEKGYVDPKCSDDLFNIVLSKFEDIKHDNEASDYSHRELYRILALSTDEETDKKIMKEVLFQKLMLMELRLRSNELFSAVREVEVYNSKKPDLQIWHRSFVINIECKIADSWSYNQLCYAVENQLMGQYLKHERNTHGIFLLARIKKKHWRPKYEPQLNYEQLVKSLQQYANELIRRTELRYNHILKIKIIALDYCLPADEEKKKKKKNAQGA